MGHQFAGGIIHPLPGQSQLAWRDAGKWCDRGQDCRLPTRCPPSSSIPGLVKDAVPGQDREYMHEVEGGSSVPALLGPSATPPALNKCRKMPLDADACGWWRRGMNKRVLA